MALLRGLALAKVMLPSLTCHNEPIVEDACADH